MVYLISTRVKNNYNIKIEIFKYLIAFIYNAIK